MAETRGVMIRQVSWAAIIGLAFAVATSGCDRGSSSSPESSACAIPTAAPDGVYASAGQPPGGGGGLQVVSHGFTQLGAGRYNVSLGAVVRNTSDKIAYRTEVRLRITDAQGRDAVHPSHAQWLVQQVPVIRPGEQVAVGSTVGTRDDVSLNGAADEVKSFEVALGSAVWLPAEDAASFPTFTAAFRGIERDSEHPESGRVQYSVTSNACRSMTPRGTAAVFFDSSGAVVGGLIDGVGDLGNCGTASYDATTVDYGIPVKIDEARTQMTEYCDLSGLANGVFRPSGAPVN
jgi:hypothetical protein